MPSEQFGDEEEEIWREVIYRLGVTGFAVLIAIFGGAVLVLSISTPTGAMESVPRTVQTIGAIVGYSSIVIGLLLSAAVALVQLRRIVEVLAHV